jgi:23S rRNA pseudouridine1911/1915/1917 synthase
MVVHPDNSHRSGTLVHGLLHALEGLSAIGGEERPGIVHRLDKGTSGVMVVACTDSAHQGLQAQFSDHSIERRYRALVLGAPDLEAGVIRSEIGRSPRDRMRMASVAKGGRRAATHWKVIERFPRATLMECRLETGRTHQVRVHLSEQGTPILGDAVYHARRTVPAALVQLLEHIDHPLLHAAHLGLKHPETGDWMAWDAPLPEDYASVLERLRAG